MTEDERLMAICYLLSDLTQLGWEKEPDLGRSGDWRPKTPEGKELFDQLVSPDNRELLRRWYARFRGMDLNPTAANLKASIEQAIGETLD
jgi:hypothetical protein